MNERTTTNWLKVREIFEDATRYSPDRRRSYVREACGGDDKLLTEIESLLDSYEETNDFLETPAVVQIVDDSSGGENLLSSGEVLGHYEITELIGAGGMGEVYLARDTRLNRKVAIKLLREGFLPDMQAKQRLLREARTAALLEHPNICQIYEIAETSDHCFIVMQYVVGTTLADILAKRPLRAADSLDLGIQIAEGLAEAHSHGIIHRDIKPANIIVNEKGQVKILDFGLAKFLEAETSVDTSARLTTSGAVMGTVPFMSPEQLRGETADERTDIFSLGVLLYEMLGGKPAFTRNSNAETISAILNDDPDWSLVPASLKPTLKRCLTKDKASRYGSVQALVSDLADARKDLTDDALPPPVTKSGRENAETNPTPSKKRQFYFWQSGEHESSAGTSEADTAAERTKPRLLGFAPLIGVSATILLLSLIAVFVWKQNRATKTPEQTDLRSVQLTSWKSSSAHRAKDYSISHNNKMIAYSSSRHGGIDNIFVKQTSGSEDIQVTKDDWANVSPLWSPDDQQIAYVSFREGQSGIYISKFMGGDVSLVLMTGDGNIALRHWSRDGSSIFYERFGNLYRLDLSSGNSIKVTPFVEKESGRDQFDFDVSPDETRLVFCAVRDGQRDIWTMLSGRSDMTRITDTKDREERPLWFSDGKRIIYNVTRNDWVQIDQTGLDGPGSETQVTKGVGNYDLIGVSDDGSKVYYSNEERRSDIVNIDLHTGKESEIAAEAPVEMWTDVSPNTGSIVYQITNSPDPTKNVSDFDLFTVDLKGIKQHLSGGGFSPHWMSDNRNIAVLRPSTVTPGEFKLWAVDSVTGEGKPLTDEDVMPPPYSKMPLARGAGVVDFSSDGEHFVYLDCEKMQNVKLGSLHGDESKSVTANENENVSFYSPSFSPDGGKIAIVSLERFTDKSIKPRWSLFELKDGTVSEIFASERSIQLIGWISNDQVLVSSNDGMMNYTPQTPEIIAIATSGAIFKVASLKDVYLNTLTLAEDKKIIAFTARRDDRDDIWTLPVTGHGSPVKVTGNSNTRLFLTNLKFASDGKSIYFDKQEQTNTISMFENVN